MQLKINYNKLFNSLGCNNNIPFYISNGPIEWVHFPFSFYISGLLQDDLVVGSVAIVFSAHGANLVGFTIK